MVGLPLSSWTFPGIILIYHISDLNCMCTRPCVLMSEDSLILFICKWRGKYNEFNIYFRWDFFWIFYYWL